MGGWRGDRDGAVTRLAVLPSTGYTLDILRNDSARELTMVTKIQKWGNSQGLRVTKELLTEAEIDVGDEVKVTARSGRIIVEAVTKVRGRYDLKKLIAKIPKNYRAEEVDWGTPTGKEAW